MIRRAVQSHRKLLIALRGTCSQRVYRRIRGDATRKHHLARGLRDRSPRPSLREGRTTQRRWCHPLRSERRPVRPGRSGVWKGARCGAAGRKAAAAEAFRNWRRSMIDPLVVLVEPRASSGARPSDGPRQNRFRLTRRQAGSIAVRRPGRGCAGIQRGAAPCAGRDRASPSRRARHRRF